MSLLVAGILLWSATHLFKALCADVRARLIARIGEWPYKGLFALLIVASLVLMVSGWKATLPTALWQPPAFLRHVTMLLVPIAVILFISARAPTDIKRFIRHPQLTGVKLWAVAHLLSNGEIRSVVLFGGLLAWAVLEVIAINRRDGAWVKPGPVGATKTLISALIGLALAAVLVYAHPWLSGMPLLPRG
ncbi:NnrU protein [Fontimonas thermophila]|uniref:NnrU protein n=1 Tax=Fontimonas thermophila TaxID=1076937 RepID=A0A1I2JEF6_9GAMM|nr:NnrU family protein [Fontimonas thermophila]SFF51041.1 NnrU protein [Fontimonas thermophila]